MSSKKPNYKRYCCAYGCLNRRKKNDEHLSFFRLPKDMERRREWLKAIDREDILDEDKKIDKVKNHFICSEHFDDSAMVTTILRRLKDDAIPTKLLPPKSKKNLQSEASQLTVTTKNSSTQSLPQKSKKFSSLSSKKDHKLVSTFPHIPSQTDTEAEMHKIQYEKEIASGMPNKDKSLNDVTVPSKPIKRKIKQKKIDNKTKSRKMNIISTQTDLNEFSTLYVKESEETNSN